MPGVFAESALAAIEFPAALEQVSQYAVTPVGQRRVRSLRPSAERIVIESELARVAAAAALLRDGEDVEPVPFPDAAARLERLRIEGSVLDGGELVEVGQVLAAARTVGAKLRRAARAHPCLGQLAAPPLPEELEHALERALEPDGGVKDDASRELARLRRELSATRGAIVAALEKLLAGLDARQRAGDAGVTVRNGRYVIPLRRDGRSRLGGIVHDESATHATLFVEPPETIELGNRLRGLAAEEAREVQRVLRELTARLRPHAEGLDAALEMLVAFDALYARARHAWTLGSAIPRLADGAGAGLALRGAAHPLLCGTGAEVVRFDLVLEEGERTVLVSGPNTGGKTVLLKAVGLAAALTQSGVVPPLGEGSVLPVFEHGFADIGDRQSIRESLSTFSAHVAAVREVLAESDAGSLVLLDELGTGTDPAEGAALAGAVLRALTERGVTTIATTHLGALKELAATTPGIVNASLAFDSATLAPTYRFAKGIPGRSYGLAIARRLGVDGAVLAEAERVLPEGERRLDATLAAAEARDRALGTREAELQGEEAALEAERLRLAAVGAEVARREETARGRERELDRAARRGLRDVLLEARAEVEQALALARAGKEKEARRALEERIAALADRDAGPGDGETGHRAQPVDGDLPGDPVPGSSVRIRSLGLTGTVESVRADDVTVLVRGRKIRVDRSDVSAAEPAAPSSGSPVPR